jgi:hypothetical protein
MSDSCFLKGYGAMDTGKVSSAISVEDATGIGSLADAGSCGLGSAQIRSAPVRSGLGRALLVGLLTLALSAPWMLQLGFSSDDWIFLEAMVRTPGHSIVDSARAICNQNESVRPVKVVYQAVLYRLFGLDPIGYHIVNTLVLSAVAVLLVVALRKAGAPDRLAIAIGAVYSTLPHYSSVRFWYAANQGPLSILLGLGSFLAGLGAVRRGGGFAGAFTALSLLLMLASVMAYETAAPLFLLQAIVIAKLSDERGSLWTSRLWCLLTAYSLILVPAFIFKLFLTPRLPGLGVEAAIQAIGRRAIDAVVPSARATQGLDIAQAALMSFVDWGLRLPKVAVTAAEQLGAGPGVLAAAVIGLLAFFLIHGEIKETPRHGSWSAIFLFGWGVVVFLLGWSIFLLAPYVDHTPTGVGNRTAEAAAIGVAFVLCGLVTVATGWLGSWRRFSFAFAIALLCAAGAIVNTALATYWVRSYRTQIAVVSAIAARVPLLSAENTDLLLHGVCQYEGPAIIFEGSWDLSSALGVRYGRSISADVIHSGIELCDDGIRNMLYGEEKLYSWARVLLFDYPTGRLERFANLEQARLWFRSKDSMLDSGCSPGTIGHGQAVLGLEP